MSQGPFLSILFEKQKFYLYQPQVEHFKRHLQHPPRNDSDGQKFGDHDPSPSGRNTSPVPSPHGTPISIFALPSDDIL